MNKELKKVIISGMVGNALEWYDFVLFVQFAPFIGRLFFPADDPNASLLAVLGVFAAGFLMRPLGGILFGYLGDKFGRKASIIISILMMSVPTALIGFLPTHEVIGIWAPIILTIIRLFQGLALGGGFSGCMTFLVEHSPASYRGLIGSASMFSLGAGVLLGILVTNCFSWALGTDAFVTWGWRLPFIISLFIGLVAFYIRGHVEESPIYLAAKSSGKISKTPVREVLFKHTKPLLLAVGVYLCVTVPFYTFSAYFNTYLQTKMGYSLGQALTINGVATAVLIMVMPISGYLSDLHGRKFVLTSSALMIGILAYPVFILMTQSNFIYPLIGQVIFAIALGLYMGPVPATLVELFPTSIRYTGLALSYNFSAAIFGGTVPFVYLNLIKYTGSDLTPSYYIMIFVALTLLSVNKFSETYKLALAD